MTTGLQLALLAGTLIGAGLAIVVWRLAPTEPDAVDVVRRYSQEGVRARQLQASVTATGVLDRVGLWAIKRVPSSWWRNTPRQQLALLQIPLPVFYGKKVLYALTGLVMAPVLTYFISVVAIPLPFVVPVGASIVLAAVLWFAPDTDVRADARAARTAFSRALGAYADGVALERLAGAGARQAMETAAEYGDSWVFKRISEELARSRWSGLAPWDALEALSAELGLPELDDLADIMRLSGEGAQVYDNLRARSAGLRSAMLAEEKAKANATNERMSVPMSLLGVVFMVIIVTPSLLRVTGSL